MNKKEGFVNLKIIPISTKHLKVRINLMLSFANTHYFLFLEYIYIFIY